MQASCKSSSRSWLRIAALMWIRETPVIHPSTQHPSTQVRKEQKEAFTNRKVFIVQIKSSTCANHPTDLGHRFFYLTSFSLYFVILDLKKYGGITRTSSTTTNLQKWLLLQKKWKTKSTFCFYQSWKVWTFHKCLKSQITLNLFFSKSGAPSKIKPVMKSSAALYCISCICLDYLQCRNQENQRNSKDFKSTLSSNFTSDFLP